MIITSSTVKDTLHYLKWLLANNLPAELALSELGLEAPRELDTVLPFRREFPSIEIQWIGTEYTHEGDECDEAAAEIEIQIDLALVDPDPVLLLDKFLDYSTAIRRVVAQAGAGVWDATNEFYPGAGIYRIARERLLEAGTLQNSQSMHLRRGLITVTVSY